ncbi:MAG: hypothetical protein LDL12_01940 [Anaerolinea sp.]|nr:hypothetical protein [Anaerolinea sp.]
MADEIRCSNCGALNPAQASVCKVCGAKLARPEEDLPDWLRDLRGGAAEDAGAGPVMGWTASAGDEEDVPDWLKELKQGEQKSAQEAAESVDLPDWFSDLSAEQPVASQPAAPIETEGQDWLSNLGGTGAGVPTAPPAEQEEDTSWLAGLQAQAGWMADLGAAEEPSAAPAEEAAAGLPDWLGSLGAAAEEPSAAPAEEAAAGLPDWLGSLGAAAEEPSAAPAEEAAAGVPDWLGSLGAAAEEPSAAPAEEAAAGLPDWLGSLGAAAEEPSAAPAEEAAAGLPDWLGSLGAAAEEPSAAPAEEAAAGLPDWLGSLGAAAEEPSAAPAEEAAAGLPDWLSNLGAAAKEPSAAPAEEAAAGVPDWLGSLGAAAEEPSAAPAEEAAAGVPDWLSSLGAAAEEPSAAPAEEAAAGVPDWLGSLGAAAEEPSAAPAEEAAAGLPDWLGSLGAAAEEPSAAPAKEAAAGVPDWLGSLGAAAEEPSAAPAEEAAAGVPDWLGSLGAAAEEPSAVPVEEAPAWMQDFQQPAELGEDWLANAPTQEVVPEGEIPLGALPDWMSDLSGAPPSASEPPLEEPAAAPSPSPFALDIPDWLLEGEEKPAALPEQAMTALTGGASSVFTELPFEETPPPFAAEPAESGAEGLEPAQMPGWLQAMRPVEAVAPTQSAADAEGRIEQAGPLAGLQGVLPGEDLASLYYRPPVYSSRLRLTERQRLNATLLENLIAEDARSKPVRPEAGVVPRRALRLAVALLLILVLLGVLGSGLPALALPVSAAPETQAFVNVLAGLSTPEQTSPPVLLVLDYQPALAGEMRLISQSVLEDLMAKNTRIVVFSMQPGGPALAQQLLEDAQAMRPSYVLEYQSLNLGYLVGGASGLQQLSLSPKAALPVTWSGKPAWDQPVLQGVQQLTDFRAVIVLTDDADAGRAWVEQVQPRLGNRPLLMVVSAQAAPLLLPYVQSGQVQGMVAGLSGGVQYEILTQRTLGNAHMAWNAYQAGLLLLLVMILIGGVYQAVRGLLATPKRKRA